MNSEITGKIIVVGDNVDTDQIYPGCYLALTDPKEISSHCLSGVDADIAARFSQGGIVVAGRNFGCGSSREHAPIALLNMGAKAVIADSFARIFFRNAVNLGLVPVICKGIRSKVQDGQTLTLDYVKGVVAGEMPSGFHIEALKAQAVAARTYSLARVIKAESGGNPDAHPDAPLCDTVHCQVYRSPSELKEIKGGEWMKDGWKRICKAVDETEGQLLYYKGSLVEQALFHSSSGGKTENSEDVFAAAVPYLVSVDSPYEDEATHSDEKNSFSIEEMAVSLKTAFPGISFGSVTSSNIKILGRSSGNRVDTMQIGDAVLSGRQVREALELPSANFTIDISGDVITFTSNGSGHGVGMSQYGADGMAKEGYDYRDILQHYYSGTQIY